MQMSCIYYNYISMNGYWLVVSFDPEDKVNQERFIGRYEE